MKPESEVTDTKLVYSVDVDQFYIVNSGNRTTITCCNEI